MDWVGPPILPAGIEPGGIAMNFIADADPASFPHGMDVIISAPGRIEPIGHLLIAKGCMVVVLPPQPFTDAIRKQVRAQIEAARKAADNGQINPPGLKT
ncbi:MAG: hypothetical protein ACREIB_11865 [Pseudomonadota bacterium]